MSGSVKSQTAIEQELYKREFPGETANSFEREINALPRGFSTRAKVTEALPVIVDRVIGLSSEKAKGNNSRITLCVAERSPSYFEALQINLNSNNAGSLKKVVEDNKVISTRCAEGIERAAHPPYCYDGSEEAADSSIYARNIMTYMHPVATVKAKKGASDPPIVGSEIFQLYTTPTKDQCDVITVKKQTGLTDKFFQPALAGGGGALPVYINGVLVVPKGGFIVSDLSTFKWAPPTDPRTKHVTEELGFQFKFNPLAVGTKKYTNIWLGSLWAINPGRPSPFGDGQIKPHKGIDCGVAPLMPIVAPAEGTVSYITSVEEAVEYRAKAKGASGGAKGTPKKRSEAVPYSGGAQIGLKHTTKDSNYLVYTGYCHIVRVGDHPTKKKSNGDPEKLTTGVKVPAGHIIAYVGGGTWGYTQPSPDSTGPKAAKSKLYCAWPGGGGSTGAHLHFSVTIKEGRERHSVDPVSFKYPAKKTFPDEFIKTVISTNTAFINAMKPFLVSNHERLYGPLKGKK